MRVLVIGAGASGLVTAKTLRERGHEVGVVEAGSAIGGTFENKAYKDARMVSSKYLTCFSDFRQPEAEIHMTLVDYVIYLRDYAAHFGVEALIRFKTRVLDLLRSEAGGYQVTLHGEGGAQPWVEEWDAVAVCSGLHNTPRVPCFPGQEHFGGEILHSSAYKDPELFRGRRVLIVGTGETAFDLGYAAATHGAQSVTMSTRHGFVSVPAYFGENLPPLDCIIMNFATHAWESQWAQRVGMHWWVTTKFTRLGFLLMTGCSYGFNQWVGKRYNMTWDEGRKHIVNKSSRCMPLLTRRAKRAAPWWQRLLWSVWDRPVEAIGQDIDLVEGSVTGLEKGAVRFETAAGARRVEADLVVLATGYRQEFPFLARGEAKAGDDPLPAQHFIVNPEEPRLAYIGFVRPNVGAIPPMAELQSMWWCQKLEGKLRGESSELDRACYRLRDSRLPYGVDYGYYMFALAREMCAVPSLLHWVFRDPRIFITCAFGQAHVPLFRLQGPFCSAEAVRTCASELFWVIVRRPVMMNTIFLVEALCFGVANACAALLEKSSSRLATLSIGLGLCLVWRPPWKALGDFKISAGIS
mmetsp:Transcript_102074/g.284161  ORF Transcript_102074/g.284161 Transcript_102074/m.284161 type:complete len:579 (+) Transcript_102074:132-1868(+)